MTLHLNIPDALKKLLESRAAETGCNSVERYVESLILADAGAEDYGAPASSSFSSSAELESKLREGIHSGPATPMAASDWASLRQKITGKGG